MIFTQEAADHVKAWIDKQVGKDCITAEVANRPENITTDEDLGFMSTEPSGDTSIYMEFATVTRGEK